MPGRSAAGEVEAAARALPGCLGLPSGNVAGRTVETQSTCKPSPRTIETTRSRWAVTPGKRGIVPSMHVGKMDAEMVSDEVRLQNTRRAFDRVAATYDGPLGNNDLIQHMRVQMWQALTATFPPGARLLDLGCGTGIDAAYLAERGYLVLATDWSPVMVERARARIVEQGLEKRAATRVLGIQDLHQLDGEQFDGIYSDLGPLNCAPHLRRTARACAAVLRPGGHIVTSVIGRICPWEVVYYIAHANWRRAFLRWSSMSVPVPLSGETVWTRYFTPHQFYGAFADDFTLTFYRGLRIFSPPPYMPGVYRRLRPIGALGDWLDNRTGALPIIRNAGDHFLMIMTKRS